MSYRGSDSQTQRRSGDRAALAPEWLPPDLDVEIDTNSVRGGNHVPAPRAYPEPVHYTAGSGYSPARGGSFGPPTPHARYLPVESPTYLSVHHAPAPAQHVAPAPVPARRSRSVSQAAPMPEAKVVRTPAPRPVAAVTPQPVPVAAPAPQPVPQVAVPMPAGLNGIDPLLVPIPPEIAPPIYSWVRRLALQADLTQADRLLRDALADLTSSLSVSIFYPGAEGLFSLGTDDEIPRDAQPIIAVAQARRAVIASHMALVPVTTTTETVAVILLQRNPRQDGYSPVEQISMLGLARESAAILHHLAVQHLQHQSEIKADQGSLYRGEALEAHRTRGHEGALAHLTPGWVKKTYPILVVTLLIATAFAILVHVNTWSTGQGLVVFDGAKVTSPAMGNVDKVFVVAGQHIKAGTPILKFLSGEEEADYALAKGELDDALSSYLYDSQDASAKTKLTDARPREQRAKAKLEARLVRSKQEGNVSDIRVRNGQALQLGEHILTLVDDTTMPEILAFMPGRDRPRIHEGMEIQVELTGFIKVRETATITKVEREVIGGNAASKYVGAEMADTLQLNNGSWVIVHAKLTSRIYKTEHNTYSYHSGMPAKTEVKLQSKPFLVSLVPALEKYLPD